MSRLAILAAALASSASVFAQTYSNTFGVYTITQDTGEDVPLASKHFQWPDLPYQADSGDGPRGTQQGYNICNATTQNQDSWCQTAYINSVDDFCLWGSPVSSETVGDVEEEMVAYCTKKVHGTRLLREGSIQGIQMVQTPDYVEIAGYIDQTALNLTADDAGGEEDPHGADERGNPLGSLLYSSAFNANNSQTNFTQVIEWSYFVGDGIFCFKACDPAGSRAAELCAHVYDRVGCTYNDPVAYSEINGTFQYCLGEDMTPPGQYVSDGITTTWFQPAESLGAITSIPYTPTIPATSQCTSYTSSAIYTELLGATGSASGSSASATGSSTGKSSGSQSSSGSVASSTSSTSAALRKADMTSGLTSLALMWVLGFVSFGAFVVAH
ncbi:uncharacterized protein STEHIDRAFT_96968 [Stereum hirsutum FP-91666 SS1]|uniref:uncharacterized protein n=1 Tax=Stereum hirsutum (strain FP-91666) TaxID=721885 RepID=UPI000440EE26|nr:uncharacterized protein STEHIDRAFT_96968 [Stereum hirsutum FP-91666 SS1]EIM87703.1 hypothetical protein STEHIDRAFT_96968 [Stereum hirsutum FP-91666 SS1]